MADPTPTTIAIAGRVPEEQIEALAAARRDLRFVAVKAGAVLAPEVRSATAMFVAGLGTTDLADLVRELPNLRWIHSASSGLDRYVLPEIAAGRIRLTRTADARGTPMAEFVLAATLALIKRLPELRDQQRDKAWRRVVAGTLSGKTVGFVGAGTVARASAARFRTFETQTLALKRTPEPLPEFDAVWPAHRLEDLLARADVVVIACPLTDATRGMLGSEQFARMKPGSILVNVARGAIVVERDLIEALGAGRPGAAALDVFEQEPLPADSPLWVMPNVLVSPHSSASAPHVWEAVREEFLDNVRRFLSGETLRNELRSADLGY